MSNSAYDAIAEWYDQSVREGALAGTGSLLASDLFLSLGRSRDFISATSPADRET